MRMDVFQDMGFFQPMGQHELFIGKKGHGRAIGYNPAFIQNNGPLAELKNQL